jgi:CubicO group peptidase (beta-lactamase class C family)
MTPAAVRTTSGRVAPGCERVVRALEQAFASEEGGGAVSAYIDGKEVVDLWWGDADDGPWERDTLTRIASSTKGALTLCAQILYERGLLDVEARVTSYWPEYGAGGKAATLVSHLLSHTAGVLTFPDYWEVVGADMAGMADWEAMTTNLAASPPSWEPGSQTMYHARTIGYLVGEVIRRIDGRSVGRFFAEEVAAPLGLEFYIGTPEPVLPRVARSRAEPSMDLDRMTPEDRRIWSEQLRLRDRARQLVRSGDVLSAEALPWSSSFQHPDLELDEAFESNIEWMNTPRMRMAELPHGNGITAARHLARMYAMLACGGELDGVRLLSPESIERFRRFGSDPDGLPVFGLGYHSLAAHWGVRPASDGAFGHAGAGGQFAFADPERRLSFGLVKNQMVPDWKLACDLAEAVYGCL